MDRDEGWGHYARCKDPRDWDMWTSESVGERRHAAHQCLNHCPVLDDCAREWLGAFRWTNATVAGVVHDHTGNLDKGKAPVACRSCVTAETYDDYSQASNMRSLRRTREELRAAREELRAMEAAT